MASTSPRRATIIRSGYGMESTSKAQPKSRVLSPIAITQEASGQWPGRPTGSVSPRQARIVLYACGKQYESMVLEVTLPFSLRAEMWYAEISVLFVLLMANLSHILLKANKKGLSIASI